MTPLLAVSVFLAAEEGGPPQTPHSWLPENYEIIFGGLASVIIFWALWKFAIPELRKGLAARSERLGLQLSSAAAARAEAITAAEAIRASKGDIGAERARLLAEADDTAARVLAEGRARLVDELASLEAKAASDITVGQGRVGAELQAQVSAIAAAATPQVVNASLDDATKHALVEDFIARVGASR